MGLTRRSFLHLGGMGLMATACGPTRSGLLADAALPAEAGLSLQAFPARRVGEPLLVVVFLRGGADGLSLVPPVGDAHYAQARGALALAEVLPFATGFGLHPALAPLLPIVERGELAVVHAVGSPDPTRSHFEAQDFMELGAPGRSGLRDGWMSRALRGASVGDPFACLALAERLPLSLRGAGCFAIGDTTSFGIRGARPDERDALASLYAAAEDDPVARAGRHALAALSEYERLVGRPAGGRAGRGRRKPGLAESARQLLAVEEAGLPLRAVFLESHDWDTHTRQGAEDGALAGRARDLAEGVALLEASLRGRRELLLAVMTEFGRTVRPNGSGGSDHGHGSVMLLAGPRVRGGLYADWRGLAERDLHEGRDLSVATDWRSVLHEVLVAHLGVAPPDDTFPGFRPEALHLFQVG